MTASGIEALLRSEACKVVEDLLRGTITDPRRQELVAEMANDLALLPLRAARGEDITPLVASLAAEAKNRALELRVLAETAAQRAWLNVLAAIIGRALSA